MADGALVEDTLSVAALDLSFRFSARLARLSFWMFRRGKLNLFISSQPRAAQTPPSYPPQQFFVLTSSYVWFRIPRIVSKSD